MTWEMLKQDTYDSGFSAGEEHGIAIGEKRGILLGRNEGITIGRNEGISLGAYQKAVETAKKFLSMGLSVEQVADGTGLSVEEIEKL